MENLVATFDAAYRGKRVLVTGHTGFKGSWLCQWLLLLGADVAGFSLEAPTTPALFHQLGLATCMRHQVADVRSGDLLADAVASFAPDYAFHLAAQPLVRYSYEAPVETFATNVLGTANILDAVRLARRPCSVVVVTTDKCYENQEDGRAFREDDRLGGHDPYSASKAAAELVVASYRKSYFSGPDSLVTLASARAGNVIGGGDWALDRIVPDAIRALQRGEPIPVRNPAAVRPFQHVLDPLCGYLMLGAALRCNPYARSAFNFGPEADSHCSVERLVRAILQHLPGEWKNLSQTSAPHEASRLNLAIDKARDVLGWKPIWHFPDAIQKTVEWYRHSLSGSEICALTQSQIRDFTRDATSTASKVG